MEAEAPPQNSSSKAFSSNFEKNRMEIHPESDGTEGVRKEKNTDCPWTGLWADGENDQVLHEQTFVE